MEVGWFGCLFVVLVGLEGLPSCVPHPLPPLPVVCLPACLPLPCPPCLALAPTLPCALACPSLPLPSPFAPCIAPFLPCRLPMVVIAFGWCPATACPACLLLPCLPISLLPPLPFPLYSCILFALAFLFCPFWHARHQSLSGLPGGAEQPHSADRSAYRQACSALHVALPIEMGQKDWKDGGQDRTGRQEGQDSPVAFPFLPPRSSHIDMPP